MTLDPLNPILTITYNFSGPPLNINRTLLSLQQIACLPLRWQCPIEELERLSHNEVTCIFVILFIEKLAPYVKTNFGFSMTYLAVQIFWPNTIIYWVNLATQVGILSPILYSTSTSVTIMLFSLILLEMRTKAPGAKTFPQVAKSRFGTTAHIIVVITFLLKAVFSVMQVVNDGCWILEAATDDVGSEKIKACIFLSVVTCVVLAEFGKYRKSKEHADRTQILIKSEYHSQDALVLEGDHLIKIHHRLINFSFE
ncbi:unnamed protein product [Dibothriocephalus latus]|uniref:Uncharacterized protein n=1 Tax=Dibothriocephalus latus TaxID=60516 RepID=A0A3P7NWY3_DIBLA|nr:unnamed protein product [Dibothriocephalus latus]